MLKLLLCAAAAAQTVEVRVPALPPTPIPAVAAAAPSSLAAPGLGLKLFAPAPVRLGAVLQAGRLAASEPGPGDAPLAELRRLRLRQGVEALLRHLAEVTGGDTDRVAAELGARLARVESTGAIERRTGIFRKTVTLEPLPEEVAGVAARMGSTIRLLASRRVGEQWSGRWHQFSYALSDYFYSIRKLAERARSPEEFLESMKWLEGTYRF